VAEESRDFATLSSIQIATIQRPPNEGDSQRKPWPKTEGASRALELSGEKIGEKKDFWTKYVGDPAGGRHSDSGGGGGCRTRRQRQLGKVGALAGPAGRGGEAVADFFPSYKLCHLMSLGLPFSGSKKKEKDRYPRKPHSATSSLFGGCAGLNAPPRVQSQRLFTAALRPWH
jgi:hypothetical protein